MLSHECEPASPLWTVVIGSGLSQLTTAKLLAGAGWEITILEQQRIAGSLM